MGEHFWLGLVHIFMIDLVLSSDNAVIIGMACRGLPLRERSRAVLYGTIGAVVLRVGLTGVTTWMLDIPLVKAIGGGLLLWIAVKLMVNHQEETTEVAHNQTIGQAVRTIILADFVMSLDNVLAVGGAAHGDGAQRPGNLRAVAGYQPYFPLQRKGRFPRAAAGGAAHDGIVPAHPEMPV